MKRMQQALEFGKSVLDNGFEMFVTMLKYKLEEKRKKIYKSIQVICK